MSLLGKEALLSRPPLKTEDVELPEFGGSIRVRQWTGAEWDEWQVYVSKLNRDIRTMRAAGIAASVINDDGSLMFNMNGDIESINSSWPASAIERVWDAVRTINRIGKEELEEAEKN